MKYFFVFFLLLLFLFFSCSRPHAKISFYYWKTIFRIGSSEQQALEENEVSKLYVRYCDVDFKTGDSTPQPVSPIHFDSTPRDLAVVPVIFIRNRTFERLDLDGVEILAKNVFNFIAGINRGIGISINEVQFDCDWTETTRANYFHFIDSYRKISAHLISATIRLHQVKYPGRTGLPPVDHGVLMYYNMGQISADAGNSIYERSIAEKYHAFIRDYPLELDVALPIFSWGFKIRDNKVVDLLNKFYFAHFVNDSNFRQLNPDRFLTLNASFKEGNYFAKNDVIKIESISSGALMEMAQQVRVGGGGKIRDIIFYDLDSSNLIQYDKDIFKKVVDRLQ